MTIERRPLRDRLLERLVPTGAAGVDDAPCWLWQGHIRPNGYARISAGGRHARQTYIHRAVYELWFGPIPAGLDIDHLCRTRACGNPAHLEAVTRAENLRRGIGGFKRKVPWATEVQARPEASTDAQN